MKTIFFIGLLASTVFTNTAIAEDRAVEVAAKNAQLIRIRPSDIASWSSDNNTSLVITTKRRERFLVDLDRSCFNLRRGSRDNALLTDSSWIDRRSGIRLLDRFAMEQQLQHNRSYDFVHTLNALGSYCPIKEITALGRIEKKKA